PHSDVTGDCSVTGGFIYRGTKYKSWYGKYFFSDYCSGIIKTLTLSAKKLIEQDVFNGDDYAYTSFGEDAKRELYISNINTGVIYHIVPAASMNATEQKSISVLQVTPNPSHGNFSIGFKAEKIQATNIVVQNMLGEVFYKQTINSVVGKNSININLHVASSVYYIVVISASGEVLSKQIKIEL
ncbi:MAG: T9SS type A sorting domain-containing protein, partial [Parafilimonas sp.]